MPSWNEVLAEISTAASSQNENPLDVVRRKYIKNLHEKTGRNIICYYSGWLQKPSSNKSSINDDDKNGLMATIHGLDRNIGLDLVLHTPGGNIAATESIVNYLRQMFGTDIRAIIPQIAMSAGTMIACSCKEIIMGKQSNLGPIDPQFGGLPAHGVLEEFNKAILSVKTEPASIPLWQSIVGKYHPTFLTECEHAIALSSEVVNEWLKSSMFKDEKNPEKIASAIVEKLNNHTDTKTHERHIHFDEAKSFGLKVNPLEEDNELQDLVLTVHHAYMHTFSNSNAIKIFENHKGIAVIQNIGSN
ncbi:hypothetical protein [Neptunomonas sp.]|uniref:SDH family Clp fold serine proteinase n=1 Tax=Neptunomonas TaxID=75687 RepID=UPI003511E4A1